VYPYTYGYNEEEVYINKGQVLGGYAIGIISLGDQWYPPAPGSVENASTFGFPVCIKPIHVNAKDIVLGKESPIILNKTIKAGKELSEKLGCRAIVGACGFFAKYQKEVAAALDVPVFLSSLMQVPIVIRSIKPGRKVGIITSNKDSLSSGSGLEQCGVSDFSNIVIGGAWDTSEVRNIWGNTGHSNNAKFEQQLTKIAKQMVGDHPDVGAILLEGSLFPPYAWAIQKAVRLPVFDYITMINWVYSAVVRRPFAGFI